MSGDDHARGGTAGRLEHYKSLDPPGCVVAKWECVRSTSYIYPNSPITDKEAADFVAEGFEIALHPQTGCSDWADQENLESVYSSQLEEFAANYPSLPAPTTNRMHCIVWSDWATQPKVELQNGIRLDASYYYWPGEWIKDRPGMFTGSGMPMRYANLDGSMIDVYQAATQMTDESGQMYPFTVDTLLDNALGSGGYYGVFTANMHTDEVESADSDAIVISALERGVPVVSTRQMLTWLDGRNQSSFGSIDWSGDRLSFTISPGPGANGLRAMVPVTSAVGGLAKIERDETPVSTAIQTIKGIEYAFFDAEAGSYTATYLDEVHPKISNVQAAVGNDGTATVSWNTNEPADSRVDYGTDPEALVLSRGDSQLVTAHSLQLSGLEPNTTYRFRVTSADAESNSSTEPGLLLAPGSFATPPAPPLLSATVPASPANQNSPQVVGSAAAGTTVKLYASADCSGSAVATATAAELEAGVAVSVPDNSSTAFRATATSGAGASTCSAPLAYVEDSGAPESSMTAQPAALVNNAAAKFEFSGEDPGGSGVAAFECRLDSEAVGAWTICTSPQEYAGLADGVHTFEVRAVDQAGNADQSPATVNWTVDTAAPSTTIDSSPPALANTATAKFEFTGEDPGGSGVAGFQCRLDSSEAAAWGTCSSPQEYAGLSEGSSQVRSAGDRQRRQRGCEPRQLRMDGRHRRPAAGDRRALQGPAEGGGDERSELARRRERQLPAARRRRRLRLGHRARLRRLRLPARRPRLRRQRRPALRGRQHPAPLPQRRRRQPRRGDDDPDQGHRGSRNPDHRQTYGPRQHRRRRIRIHGRRPERLRRRRVPVPPGLKRSRCLGHLLLAAGIRRTERGQLTSSKRGRSTTPATQMRAPPPSNGRSTPSPRSRRSTRSPRPC